VAPGEIVTIFGVQVGPNELVGTKVGSDRKLATQLGGTQVLFDGVPAPMLYTSAGQTAAIVPFGVSGLSITALQVLVNGFLSNSVTLYVEDEIPGIFTVDASGAGQAAVLNQDYSVNSPANPAKQGSVIMVYATGLGLVNPPVADGAITGTSPSKQVQPVTATVGPNQADVLYAGTAPGLVAGVSQINIRLPAGTPSGIVKLSIGGGYGPLQSNVTIAVE